MQGTPAPLRPLDDAADAIRRLDEYESPGDLAAAITAVAAAVERSLRLRLRADPHAPDEMRLTAMSPEALPPDELVRALRSRELISIDLAGSVHELRTAADGAASGTARPADADVARTAVGRLRSEFRAVEPAPLPEMEPDEEAAADPAPEAGPVRVRPPGRPRRMAWLASAVAAAFVLLLAWVILRGGNADYEAGIIAFRSGRLDSAAAAFERVRADRPDDVSTLLYLGRIHRRLGRPAEAAEVLRAARDVDPDDPDVRREFGHLLMDLDQPRAAVRQYELALEQEPEEPLNWASLIRALRAAGDPRAEELLRDAPPEVQAALGSGP